MKDERIRMSDQSREELRAIDAAAQAITYSEFMLVIVSILSRVMDSTALDAKSPEAQELAKFITRQAVMAAKVPMTTIALHMLEIQLMFLRDMEAQGEASALVERIAKHASNSSGNSSTNPPTTH